MNRFRKAFRVDRADRALRALTWLPAGVLLLAACSTAFAGMITYSGTGSLTVRASGSDPWGLGPATDPLDLSFSITVDDAERLVQTESSGDFIALGPANFHAGTLTVGDTTGVIEGISLMRIYDDADFSFSAYPMIDAFQIHLSATLNGSTEGIVIRHHLDPNTYSFSGTHAAPPVLGEQPVIEEITLAASSDYLISTTTADTLSSPVPEPSSLALFGIGGLSLLGWRRRRQRPSIADSNRLIPT